MSATAGSAAGQHGLAEKLGISLWALDQIERGRGDATPYLAGIRAATGLAVPVSHVEPLRGSEVSPLAKARERGA